MNKNNHLMHKSNTTDIALTLRQYNAAKISHAALNMAIKTTHNVTYIVHRPAETLRRLFAHVEFLKILLAYIFLAVFHIEFESIFLEKSPFETD